MLLAAVVQANRGHASPTAEIPPTRALPAQRLAGLRLLVVEDNVINQQIAHELLGQAGATVTLAGGGLAGVQEALSADPPYDALLMDVQMPDLDGLEATRRIRAHQRMHHMPIIAMTANVMDSDKAQCLAAGMVDHVGKPIDKEQLVAKLLRHTSQSAARSEDRSVCTTLDSVGAISRISGDQALYLTVAYSFCTDALAQFSAFEQAVRGAKWRESIGYTHTLKGLAATVGAMALSRQTVATELALQAAELSDSMKPEQADHLLAALELSLQNTLRALHDLVPAHPEAARVYAGSDAPPESERLELHISLEALAGLLTDNNMRSTALSADLVQRYSVGFAEPLADVDASVQLMDRLR